MSSAYKFYNPDGIYFTTTTVVQWVDVFTRPEYATIVIDSLRFCQLNKGLIIHAWCLMTNHLHMIISRNGSEPLEDIIRDFKKFTSAQLIRAINDGNESRRNWMNWIFRQAGERNPNNRSHQFWQQHNHPEELITNKFVKQKLDYIHINPVRAGIVYEPEQYVYSSAGDYAGAKGLIEISFIN